MISLVSNYLLLDSILLTTETIQYTKNILYLFWQIFLFKNLKKKKKYYYKKNNDNKNYNFYIKKVPPKGKYSDYIEFINKLPNNQPASLFGFHENAMIARDLKETDELCNALLLISNSSGKSVQTASGSG